MEQGSLSKKPSGRQVPAAPQRLTFFLSSGLSFFITSWRASSSFFFSSADDVALIVVMKVNVCATTQPVRFGWEEPHRDGAGGARDGAGGAPCTAEYRCAARPRSTTSSCRSAACRADIAEDGVICEAGPRESANSAIGASSPQKPLGSSSHRDHQHPFRPPFHLPSRAMRQLTRAARASAASALRATASRSRSRESKAADRGGGLARRICSCCLSGRGSF